MEECLHSEQNERGKVLILLYEFLLLSELPAASQTRDSCNIEVAIE